MEAITLRVIPPFPKKLIPEINLSVDQLYYQKFRSMNDYINVIPLFPYQNWERSVRTQPTSAPQAQANAADKTDKKTIYVSWLCCRPARYRENTASAEQESRRTETTYVRSRPIL